MNGGGIGSSLAGLARRGGASGRLVEMSCLVGMLVSFFHPSLLIVLWLPWCLLGNPSVMMREDRMRRARTRVRVRKMDRRIR